VYYSVVVTHYLSTILCPIGGCSTINTFTNGDDNDDDCITSQQPSQADIILDVPIIPPHLYKQSKDIIKTRMYFAIYRLHRSFRQMVGIVNSKGKCAFYITWCNVFS
jgi:hypothetical protein